MDTSKYLVKKEDQVKLKNYGTAEDHNVIGDESINEKMPERVERLKQLHTKLLAEEEKGIVVVLQAMDAAEKDEAITYLFSNLTAQGLKTTSFKKPSEAELKMDYLRRFQKGLPERGQIGIFNRSYYEEVIAPRVHDLLGETPLPDELIDEQIWDVRYRQINNFEQYLVENGFPVVKFFFNVSKDEQKKRLLKRMKDPEKNWEFSFNDVKERQHWDGYQEIFEDLLNKTSTEFAPWYILPADNEEFSRYIITEVMIELLEKINPQFPEISGEEKEELDEAVKMLENE
ncbi:PPK2 family polyphosphate kinase [Planococcus sp. NCCP-2050]|uniref:PPK2 family polyphosphate kinase n=1 Tax=Planococcus sp. NCCP-2050 TaxID=2944679 RepID=UPI002041F011|nr:PPK2 family polyphosphate kinase [Planococcus sp. NCCP-2050]GKW47190.1 PPK2 family polyphosphate--nucleotide phosphotransferase [Planococcus sp. NCCP-2050]